MNNKSYFFKKDGGIERRTGFTRLKTALNSPIGDMPGDFTNICPWCWCIEISGSNRFVKNWKCGHSAKIGFVYFSNIADI